MEEVEKNSRGLTDLPFQHGNILLTGASGSGKSTIGRQTAKLLGLGFIDLDELIEKVLGRKINEIFAKDGELVFREYESKMLSSLQNIRSHVIAVGGGALLSNDSFEVAKKIGPVVWIQSSAMEISRRLYKRVGEMENRPLFRDLVVEESHEIRRERIKERAQRLMDERRAWYSRADVILDGSYVTPEMAAQHLKDILVTEGLMKLDQGRFASWHKKGSS